MSIYSTPMPQRGAHVAGSSSSPHGLRRAGWGFLPADHAESHSAWPLWPATRFWFAASRNLPRRYGSGEHTPCPRRHSARLHGGAVGAGGGSGDDLFVAQGLDVGGGEAALAQDGVGMLPRMGRGGAHGTGRSRELDGDAEFFDGAQGRVLDLDHHVAGLHLRVGDHLLRVVHLADTDVRLDEQLVPLVTILGPDDGFDLVPCLDLFGVGRPHELVVRPREAHEIGAPDGLAEVLP